MSTTTPQEHFAHLKQEKPLCHPGVFAQTYLDYEYAPPAHVREIYHSVFEALDPEIPYAPKNICRLEPREHAKSEAGSVVVPTWAALRDPNIRILIMMETEPLAKGKLQECSDYINQLAPRFNREIEVDNKTELQLAREETYDTPTIKAAGFRTGVTGGHFDVIVMDDVVTRETQRTQHQRDRAWEKFQEYINLGSEGETVRTVLGTRKHPKDLYSNLLASPGWDTRVEKAISDWSVVENSEYDVLTIDDDRVERRYSAEEIPEINTDEESVVDVFPHREVEVLWPERWPLSDLIHDMITGFGKEQGTLVWKRENQNDAEALQGQVLSKDMLNWVSSLPGRQSDYVRYAGIDLAVEKDAERAAANDTDFFAIAVLAMNAVSGSTFLEGIHRKRGMTLGKAISWADGILGDYERVVTGLVESNNSQEWFVQQGRTKYNLPLEASNSSGKKEDRIIGMTPMLESGDLKIVDPQYDPMDDYPSHSEEWQDFEDEFTEFPDADHDDQLDAVEIALRNLNDENEQKQTRVYDIGF